MREKIAREKQHKHYGGGVYATDFYDADYYNPRLHLKHFLEDWDFDIKLHKRQEKVEVHE